jgi:Phytanoyl-CoA dioxygenase (PhyH)
MTLFIDLDVPAPQLRQTIYQGDLVILTSLRSVGQFVDYTREELAELFKPYDPERAHEYFDKAAMADLLASWKPRFIHSATSKELVCNIIREVGFCAEGTHYDLPKPRTSFPMGHLNTGIAYAFPWHRDVWYSAPAQQINWWLPVFTVRDDNCMCFDPRSFDRAVTNTSGEFDYYRNNTARLNTASQISDERQTRPAALNHTPVDELVVVPAPGAVMLFSGAQLHSSIPNTSGKARFSVDFRTVDVADLTAGRGAQLVDADCTGTAIRDFRRVADGAPFDEDTVIRLFGTPPRGSTLVFAPPAMDGLHVS